MSKNILCLLGLHRFKIDHKYFWSSDLVHPHAMWTETCTNCGQKSLIRAASYGWAGKEKSRELIKEYPDGLY